MYIPIFIFEFCTGADDVGKKSNVLEKETKTAQCDLCPSPNPFQEVHLVLESPSRVLPQNMFFKRLLMKLNNDFKITYL